MSDIATAGISAPVQMAASPTTVPEPQPDAKNLLTLLEKQLLDHRRTRQQHLLHQIRGKDIRSYPSPVSTLTPVSPLLFFQKNLFHQTTTTTIGNIGPFETSPLTQSPAIPLLCS